MHRFTPIQRAALAVLAVAAFLISPPAASADAQTLTGTYVVWLQIAPGIQIPSVQT